MTTTSYVYLESQDILSMTYVPNSLTVGASGQWPDPDVSPGDGGWRIAVTCDLTNSTPPAVSFNNLIPSQNNLWGSHSGGPRPAQLNFWFAVDVIFQAGSGSFTTRILLGQGHKKSGNNWWIGGTSICNGAHDKEVVCIDEQANLVQVLTLQSLDVDHYKLTAWFPRVTQATDAAATLPTVANSPAGSPSISVMSLTSDYITNVTYIAGSLNCSTPVYDGPNVTQNGLQWTVDLQCDLEASPQVADAFMNMVVSANHVFGPDSGASSPEALNFFLGLKVEFSIGGLVFSTDLFVGQGNSSGGGNDWWIGGTVLGCDGSQALIAFSEPDEAVLQVLAVDTSASGAFVLDPYWTSLQPLPDQSAWMAGLDPTLSIGAINLPGSHDSAAIGGWTRFWTTQSLSLTDQFNAGVRLFDIRVAVRQPEPDGPYVFYTCHGDAGAEIDANLFQTLESALDELQAVLQPEGTQEFIVMSLKIDDDGGFSPYEFVADLETLLTGIDNLLCSPSLPTVGQAQGKIYVVNRVRDLNLAAADLAIPDNTPGDLLPASSDHRFSVYVQDQYEDYDGNPVTVKLGLYQDAVQAGTAADVLLNFASGTTCVVFGVYIDQFILQWLGASPAATRPARLGWTLHDFVDAAYGTDKYGAMSLIQIVVASNFGYAAYPETFNPFAPGAVLPTAPSRALRRAFRARRAALRAEAASSNVPARAPENTPA